MSDKEVTKPTELDFLKFFYAEADFGPADSDVRRYIFEKFIEKYGSLPEGWEME